MADLVIKGLGIPKERSLWLCIKTDGTVYNIKPGGIGTAHAVGTAVPLPEGHGRLVDAREVLEKADKAQWFDGDVAELGLLLGSEVTTIIPAEGVQNDVQK